MKRWPEPKTCPNCKWGEPESRANWNTRCFHPVVVMSDAWALANTHEGLPPGVNCSDERGRRWGKCGQKGKLYELRAPAKAEQATNTQQAATRLEPEAIIVNGMPPVLVPNGGIK